MPALAHWNLRARSPAKTQEDDRAAMAACAGSRLELIAESFARLSGRPLIDNETNGLERGLWEAPRAIAADARGVEARFFYGNRALLDLLGMTVGEFIGTPSRLLAEPVLREERQRMIDGLARHDIVDVYAVVGITTNGRRFAIENAQIWNLVDRRGGRHGLGTTFADWRFLDGG